MFVSSDIGFDRILAIHSIPIPLFRSMPPTIISFTQTELITYVARCGRGKGIGGGREGKGGSSSKLHLGSSVVRRTNCSRNRARDGAARQ